MNGDMTARNVLCLVCVLRLVISVLFTICLTVIVVVADSACYRTLRDSEVRAVARRVAAARQDLSVAEVNIFILMNVLCD